MCVAAGYICVWLNASVALVFCISCCWSLLYSATLRSQADSQCSHAILHEWIAFYSAILCSRADSQCSHVILHEWIAFYSAILCSQADSQCSHAILHEWIAFYSAILCSQADSQCSHAILHERTAFYSALLNIHWSGVLTVVNVVNNCKELCELFWIRARHKC